MNMYFITTRNSVSAIFLLCFLFPLASNAADGTVETITYFSNTQNTECNMNIYLPPGYTEEADTANAYPVFYLIHGGGENYTHWVKSGDVKLTLDDYIPSGKAVPMIIVMPDAKNLAPEVFRDELVNDIIPYMEENYRVIADKDHRGVGGLSWGGLQAMETGIYDYEMYGYLSILSSGWFTNETATYNRARTFLEENSAAMEENYRYFYFAEGTESDLAYENGLATLALFKEFDLTVHYWEHTGGHTWSAWREDFKAFAPYLFRDSSTVYIALDFMGGNITNSTATVMTRTDTLATAPSDPRRTGYSFMGWYTEPEYTTPFNFESDTVKTNMTLYADWEINIYKVSFNANGGTPITDTLYVEYYKKIDEPDNIVNGDLLLEGWYLDDAFTNKWNFESHHVTKNMTLVARWVDPSTLSVENPEQAKITCYPNPTQNNLYIKNLRQQSKIILFNMQGEVVRKMQTNNTSAILDLSEIPAGNYVLKVEGRDQSFSEKIQVR